MRLCSKQQRAETTQDCTTNNEYNTSSGPETTVFQTITETTQVPDLRILCSKHITETTQVPDLRILCSKQQTTETIQVPDLRRLCSK